MTEILTEELLNELLFTERIEDYLDRDEIGDEVKLYEYLNEILVKKDLKKSEVINKSRLNTTFGYQIFSGERNPGRDKIIQLSFAMDLSLKETQRALKFGGVNELYPKDKRDAVIIFNIKKGNDLDETNDSLFRFQQKTIYED